MTLGYLRRDFVPGPARRAPFEWEILETTAYYVQTGIGIGGIDLDRARGRVSLHPTSSGRRTRSVLA
jgi:hypothetical protein